MGETPTVYVTSKSGAYVDMPKNFVRARPLKTKNDLVKTNYSVSVNLICINSYKSGIAR